MKSRARKVRPSSSAPPRTLRFRRVRAGGIFTVGRRGRVPLSRRDTVLLTKSRWVFRSSMLLWSLVCWKRDRAVDPRAIEDVILVRDRLWIQMRGGDSFTVVAAGTSADRAWFQKTLRGLLGGRLRRRVEVDHRLRPTMNDVPAGFMLLEDLTGVLVGRAPVFRLRRLAPLALLCLAWNGLLAGVIAVLSLADRGAVGAIGARFLGDGRILDVTGPVWWLFVSPWILVGALLLLSLLTTTLDRTRLRLAPGSLHIERRGIGRRDRTKFDGAELFVSVAPTSLSGRPRFVHMLHVTRADGRIETLFQDRSFSRIAEIARWIALRTGFPVI